MESPRRERIPLPLVNEVLRFYRPLGFFERYADFVDDEMRVALQALWRERGGGTWWGPDDARGEFLVVGLDDDRIWTQDLEADWDPEGGIYNQVLGSLERISRRTLSWSYRRSRWIEEDEEEELELEVGGTKHLWRISYTGGWLDLDGLFENLNPLMVRYGIQFTDLSGFRSHPDWGDQCANVIALRYEERRRLENEKGWILKP